MKATFALVLVLSPCLIATTLVRAQEGSQSSASSQQSSGVDSQGIRKYLLGPGDLLDVRVFGQPDLNAVVDVDSDGNISSLPFLETPIPAKCRTEKQIQKDIATAYSKYLKNPQVSVRISERRSRAPATITGAVRAPARMQMQRKVRLNELVAAAGGFTERASGTIQVLHTEPLMCPEPGEEAEAAPIDPTKIPLQLFKISELKTGRLEANPVIRPGDYVLVTEGDPVYITGAVVAPQGVYLRDQLTLSRAMAMVGGARKEARTEDIRVYRQKLGSLDQEIIKVDYSAIRKNQKPDFVLQAFDVVDVPEAGMFSKGRIGSTLVSAVSGSLQNVFSSVGYSLPTKVLY